MFFDQNYFFRKFFNENEGRGCLKAPNCSTLLTQFFMDFHLLKSLVPNVFNLESND